MSAVNAKTWNWKGARWWRCDLHTHSPGSEDWRDGPVDAAAWVRAATSAGLQVVALTDHNGGDWVDDVKTAAASAGLRVFPGTELTTRHGIHLLVLFDPSNGKEDVHHFLSKVNIKPADRGSPMTLADVDFFAALQEAARLDTVAIAPHFDDKKGLVYELCEEAAAPGTFRGNQTLQEIIRSPALHAVEIATGVHGLQAFIDGSKGDAYARTRPLGRVWSSDAHRLSELGRRSTWIKMTTPSLEGLRLAILDGPLSVKNAADTANPNTHASCVIESIAVENAVNMGHPRFLAELNPWLNAIIGGRGSGKSSVIEFLRLALGRTDDLPESLREELGRYHSTTKSRSESSLLKPEAVIEVIYRKDGTRYRLRWQASQDAVSIEEETDAGVWQGSLGDVRTRFPARIFSQKHIFELSKEPASLLRLVDEAGPVDRRSSQDEWDVKRAHFQTLRSRSRELEAFLLDEQRLRGELSDLERRLRVFEEGGHEAILTAYQRSQRQRQAVEDWEKRLRQVAANVTQVGSQLAMPVIEASAFAPENDVEREILQLPGEGEVTFEAVRAALLSAGASLAELVSSLRARVQASAWSTGAKAASDAYDALVAGLEAEGESDPTEYAGLVARRNAVERQLAELSQIRSTAGELERERAECLAHLAELRQKLTQSRRQFLESTLASSQHVSIRVVPHGIRPEDLLREIRQLVRREEGFDTQLDLLTQPLRSACEASWLHPEDTAIQAQIQTQLSSLKAKIRELAETGSPAKGTLEYHLRTRLQPSDLDLLDCWWPEDALDVRYSPSGNGQFSKTIEQGSPGQRTAALLSFLLSYGNEPLVLDQPEDDLDNELVYSLIVPQLREIKAKRQVLVATHSPNIVVNADAELVTVLAVGSGQSYSPHQGGLQEEKTRSYVCNIMEGGRQAFELRYQRMTTGATP